MIYLFFEQNEAKLQPSDTRKTAPAQNRTDKIQGVAAESGGGTNQFEQRAAESSPPGQWLSRGGGHKR